MKSRKRSSEKHEARLLKELEEELYAQVAAEISEERVAPGLMAKAYSETEGDEKKAK